MQIKRFVLRLKFVGEAMPLVRMAASLLRRSAMSWFSSRTGAAGVAAGVLFCALMVGLEIRPLFGQTLRQSL
jgi:hypothetical protein